MSKKNSAERDGWFGECESRVQDPSSAAGDTRSGMDREELGRGASGGGTTEIMSMTHGQGELGAMLPYYCRVRSPRILLCFEETESDWWWLSPSTNCVGVRRESGTGFPSISGGGITRKTPLDMSCGLYMRRVSELAVMIPTEIA